MFELKFQTANAAFDGTGRATECARVLRDIADKLDRGCASDYARDINGNKIGDWWISTSED